MRHTANRLTGMAQNGQTVNYRYNGLGDRLVEGETEFEMDLNTGLTQVLADGTNTYMYGNGRIGQFTGVESAYFLGDALGSVRQLVNEGGVLMITKNYEPYGEVIKSQGSGASKYGFAGEQVDRMELIYLRARYYSSDSGRFITRDTWEGNDLIPISYNAWLYGYSNPMSFSDPSGKCPVGTENVGNGICEPVDGPVPQKPGDNSPLPPTEGYDPTQPPQEGISWVPFVDPLRAGAPGLPKNKNGAQNSVPGWEGTKNLCGLVSLAAIFHAYDSQITTSDLVSKFDYWRHHLAPNKDWAPKGPGYQGIDELVNFVNYRYYPHWIARKYALGH